MPKEVIIVESPGKVKTINQSLGNKYNVLASYGHVRDLPKKSLGIDAARDFKLTYTLNPDRKEQIAAMQRATSQAPFVYLAQDPDREGEAMAYHIREILGLAEGSYGRITFTEITQEAITTAINNPRPLDPASIHAQQTRRCIDRYMGYKASPLLWSRIGPNLSAGRVQSVAARLVVERERAIYHFTPTRSFKVKGSFESPEGTAFTATCAAVFPTYEAAKQFLAGLDQAQCTITAIQQTLLRKAPPPPFMTSTLQQEAAQRLHFSLDRIMRYAQKLYEKGHITYMRTDSLHLSQEALQKAKAFITKRYGTDYHQQRTYKTQALHAQEAHEAIRPTRFTEEEVSDHQDEQRLYELIRQRAIASQMCDARFQNTTVTIGLSTAATPFTAKGKVIQYPGYLAAYPSSLAPSVHILPPLALHQTLKPTLIEARESFGSPPARYTEATLVKKMESLGIGRPSTYRPTISTIQERGYVEKASRQGKLRPYRLLTWQAGHLTTHNEEETVGSATHKLFPTSVGNIVNDFLLRYFSDIVDYSFTAKTESKLDAIAHGRLAWKEVLRDFYEGLTQQLARALQAKDAEIAPLLTRELGRDPQSGKMVTARLSRRAGPLIQLGTWEEAEKPRFASLGEGQLLDQITLEEALKRLQLPREVGELDGAVITVHEGRFGPYLKYQGRCFSLEKTVDPFTLTAEDVLPILTQGIKSKSPLKTFDQDPTITIHTGRFGPYVKGPQGNVSIPKKLTPNELTLEACKALLAAKPTRRRKIRTKTTT